MLFANTVSGVSLVVGDRVDFYYPTHGRFNVLRHVVGEVINSGRGPNGVYITVQEDNGLIRTMSLKKVVVLR